jgi:hypothetical protein
LTLIRRARQIVWLGVGIVALLVIGPPGRAAGAGAPTLSGIE